MRYPPLFFSFSSSHQNILRKERFKIKRKMRIMKGEEKNNLLKKAVIIADYQFSAGAGEILFSDSIEFILSRTRRISQIEENGKRIATLRSFDGLLTLSIEGAKRLHHFFKYPRQRVVMNEESSEFIRKGGTAFCKHVIDADPEIRAYDEVILVDEKDKLLATGKAMLSCEEMKIFDHGVAVKVRYGTER
jgi:predicted RNA-binding protein (TIGR00451 family)